MLWWTCCAVAAAWKDQPLRINAICPGGVDTGIVPHSYERQGFMHPDIMAAEAVDLLLSGASGEIRVKLSEEMPAFVVDTPELRGR